MSAFVKFQQFVEDLGNKVHNLDADTLKVMLTNTAPDVAANKVLGDLTEIGTGHGYSTGGVAVTTNNYAQSGGVAKLTGDDQTFTASGGSIGPFRYAVLYNSTPTSPLKPLIGYWDYGSSITLADTETFTVDFDGTNGILQIT